MKLYSDILKGKEMDQSEIPMETVQAISVASGYDLDLIPCAYPANYTKPNYKFQMKP